MVILKMTTHKNNQASIKLSKAFLDSEELCEDNKK